MRRPLQKRGDGTRPARPDTLEERELPRRGNVLLPCRGCCLFIQPGAGKGHRTATGLDSFLVDEMRPIACFRDRQRLPICRIDFEMGNLQVIARTMAFWAPFDQEGDVKVGVPPNCTSRKASMPFARRSCRAENSATTKRNCTHSLTTWSPSCAASRCPRRWPTGH